MGDVTQLIDIFHPLIASHLQIQSILLGVFQYQYFWLRSYFSHWSLLNPTISVGRDFPTIFLMAESSYLHICHSTKGQVEEMSRSFDVEGTGNHYEFQLFLSYLEDHPS